MSRLAVTLVFQYGSLGAFLPFVSLFFRDMGVSYAELGSIFFASAAMIAFMPIVWGLAADRFVAVNRLIVCLHVAAAIVLVALAAQRSYFGALFLFALWSAIGLPTNSLSNALCYHNLPRPEVDFGRLRLWGSIGWMLPSLPVSLWLAFQSDVDLRFTLWLAAALEACFLLVAFLMPHTPPQSRAARHDGPGFRAEVLALLRRPKLVLLLLAVFFLQWAFSVHFTYTPIQLEAAGIARPWISPFQCLSVLLEVPLFLLMRPALARLGSAGTLLLGASMLLSRHILFLLSSDVVVLAVAQMLTAMTVVFYIIPVSLVANAMAGRALRSTAQTLLLIAGPGLGSMTGQLTSGFVAQHYGVGVVCGIAAGVALLAMGILPWVFREGRDRPEASA